MHVDFVLLTVCGWVNRQNDGSAKSAGRPRKANHIRELIVRMKANPGAALPE